MDDLSQYEKSQLSQKDLEDIIESSYDGIYITDGKANTLIINKAYEELTGLNKEDMLGKNMLDLEKEGYISKSATLMVLKYGRSVTIEQEFNTGKKLLVSSNPIFDEDRQIALVVTNVRDVTLLLQLKEQLEKNKELTKKYYSQIEEMKLQLLHSNDIIAEDENMIKTIKLARRAAKVKTTVLLRGETGVGKEEIAKLIHKESTRNANQFIEINCGAIPHALIEAELFGYERGAFTGANKEGKLGLFEIADGGTIFLDEIGDLPLDMQVKLLRVLQEEEIFRIGGVKPIKIDVRIIAATNKNLEQMVTDGNFREDLYYRLNVVPITIPPLRERKGDIIPLANHFLMKFNEKHSMNKTFSSQVLKYLFEYSWHGNVRELKNIIERLVIMGSSHSIEFEDLPNEIKELYKEKIIDIKENIMPLKDAVETLEFKLINNSYKKYGNVRDAAKALNIDASTFVRKRKRYSERDLLHK